LHFAAKLNQWIAITKVADNVLHFSHLAKTSSTPLSLKKKLCSTLSAPTTDRKQVGNMKNKNCFSNHRASASAAAFQMSLDDLTQEKSGFQVSSNNIKTRLAQVLNRTEHQSST